MLWRSSVVVSSNNKLRIIHHSCSPDSLPHKTISETTCVLPYPTSYQHRHEFISVWVEGDNIGKLVSFLWKGCWEVSGKATSYFHQFTGIKRSYRSSEMPSDYFFHWYLFPASIRRLQRTPPRKVRATCGGILSLIKRNASPKEEKIAYFLVNFT